MPLNRWSLLAVALIALVAWWVLRDDDEDRVRAAHAELARLLSKTEDASTGATLLNARALDDLFAPAAEVTGDAGPLAGTYSPDDVLRTIVQVQTQFRRIDLTFGELAIEFPEADRATVRFSAELVASRPDMTISEARNVVSRMDNVDGQWLFSRFALEYVSPISEP